MGNFIKLTFEIQAEYVKQVWYTSFMLWEYLEISVKLQMVYAMYTRCSREQPGVAERSDADDRLRRCEDPSLQFIPKSTRWQTQPLHESVSLAPTVRRYL